VGHYYAAATTTTSDSTTTNPTFSRTTPTTTGGGGGGGYYAGAPVVPPAAATVAADAADQWDWSTPAAATESSDWYGTGTATGSTNIEDTTTVPSSSTTNTNTTTTTAKNTNVPKNYMYRSSGFYGSSTTATNNNSNNTMMMAASEQDPFLSGTMDDTPYATPAATSTTIKPAILQPQTFVPRAIGLPTGNESNGSLSDNMTLMGEEAPLLEELGINLTRIYLKTKAVVLPFGRFGGTAMQPSDIVQDADLAGPIAFALILGAEMVLTGRFQFGYIYGFGVFGCISMTLIVNLMTSVSNGISIWTVSSVLGYALIPVNVLAAVKLVVMNLIRLQTFGQILGILTVAWSTVASTRLLELGCGLREQRYLIAYPIGLLYSAFVMITIF
jgi:hypothetical protein